MDSGEQLKTLTSPELIGPNDRFGLNQQSVELAYLANNNRDRRRILGRSETYGEYAECTYLEEIVVVVLPYFSELFAPKEDFAKVPIIVQIIRFPPLNKPNFGRLCHY